MDPTKRRLFLGIGGAIFGFTGIVALMAAFAIFLASYLGPAGATAVTGGLYILIAVGMMILFLKPFKASAEEMDQFEDATADALADLPFDTLKSMVEKRPLAMTGLAAVLGYALASDDNDMGKRTLQRVFMGLI